MVSGYVQFKSRLATIKVEIIGCNLLAMRTSCRARYLPRRFRSGNEGFNVRVVMFRPQTPNRIEERKTGTT